MATLWDILEHQILYFTEYDTSALRCTAALHAVFMPYISFKF